MDITNFLNVGFLVAFGVMGLLTLNQLRTYLFVLQQIKENELVMVKEQSSTKKEEAQASLPMDALNSTAINEFFITYGCLKLNRNKRVFIQNSNIKHG
jgi:hypothetical protein